MKKGDTILIPIHHPLFVLFVHSGYFELTALCTHMIKVKANVTTRLNVPIYGIFTLHGNGTGTGIRE